MKRFITLTTLTCMFFLSLHAQEVKLTIENTAGGLKEAMTPEEIKTVTDLTLTGSMNDADFYLIRDSMRRLDYLDLKYVHVDTIPTRALYNSSEPEIILPVDVKFLGDTAFYSYDNNIYITGEFPKLGKGVFLETTGEYIFTSEDNTYCKRVGENIYSINGKILYLCRGDNSWKIEEGTEIIESRALDEAWFNEFILPSSVKLIKENAFSNFHFNGTNGGIWHDEIAWFISEAKIPPVLEKEALDAEALSRFTLNVSVGTKEIYRQVDPQWSVFKDITDYPSGIESIKNQPFSVETNNTGEVTVNSEMEIASVEIISLSGKLLQKEQAVNCRKVLISRCPNQNFIIRVVFQDGSEYSLKYIL